MPLKILKKIFTNVYVIAGMFIFLLLLGIGLYLDFSVGEALFGSAVLAAIGTVSIWWEREWWG
jgi:hypothetical protein